MRGSSRDSKRPRGLFDFFSSVFPALRLKKLGDFIKRRGGVERINIRGNVI